MASDPAAFAANADVVAFLNTAGSEGLPLVLVDDETVMTGRYPTRAELSKFAGLALDPAQTSPPSSTGGCCGGSSAGCGQE
ncbi:arsenic metallochaperone ArsD family protein [Tessaracoccus sp.]